VTEKRSLHAESQSTKPFENLQTMQSFIATVNIDSLRQQPAGPISPITACWPPSLSKRIRPAVSTGRLKPSTCSIPSEDGPLPVTSHRRPLQVTAHLHTRQSSVRLRTRFNCVLEAESWAIMGLQPSLRLLLGTSTYEQPQALCTTTITKLPNVS